LGVVNSALEDKTKMGYYKEEHKWANSGPPEQKGPNTVEKLLRGGVHPKEKGRGRGGSQPNRKEAIKQNGN